jgi:hypothetical protein
VLFLRSGELRNAIIYQMNRFFRLFKCESQAKAVLMDSTDLLDDASWERKRRLLRQTL